jgi:hypothetical protein
VRRLCAGDVVARWLCLSAAADVSGGNASRQRVRADNHRTNGGHGAGFGFGQRDFHVGQSAADNVHDDVSNHNHANAEQSPSYRRPGDDNNDDRVPKPW